MTLYLIARLGDEGVALDTRGVASVVGIERIAPVPRVAPHVLGLSALRSRVLTVIDGRQAVGLGPIDAARAIAVACDVDGHGYALLLDAVDDVVEAGAPEACPVALAPAWSRVATGLLRVDGRTVLLLDPAALVAGPEALAA